MKIASLLAVSFLCAAPSRAQDVARTPSAVRPLLIGAQAPDATLRALDGSAISIKTALGGKPGVVIFYRGGWCPYCSTHLREIKTVEKDLKKLGYRTIAISPDRPEELAATAKKQDLAYTLLSDSKLEAARAYGIAFQVDEGTLKKYGEYGIDLRKSSGEAHDWLPVPTVFLIGKDGTVKFVYSNPDYKVRLKAPVLLAAAKAALAGGRP